MINSSIIIPFKNSEKSIIKTLKSITMQNVNSDLYEVLLINDFSNDKSMHTIKKYINNLKNFKLYKSKKNIVGPGHARNVGISYSSGRYILFLDSDDCLKKGCLNKIINKTNIIKCDVYAFGFNIVDTLSNMKRKKRHDLNLMRLNKIEIIKKYFESSIIPQVISNLFLREFLIKNKIDFKKGYFEDVLFFLKSIYFSKSIKVNSAIFYIKYNVSNSIVNTISKEHILYHFKAYTDSYNFIIQRKITKVMKNKLNYFYIKGIIGLTAVYIKKVVGSNVITYKKKRFLLNIYKLYSKILLASKINYVYKTDKDKFVKNFFKITNEK